MSNFLNALVGKFSAEHRKDLSEGLNVSWEEDKHVRNCRRCEKDFSTMCRKHHCRGCGGIYCDDCIVSNVQLPDIEDRVKACIGCCKGETPGDRVRKIAKDMEATITEKFDAAPQIKAMYGSLYSENQDAFKRKDGCRAHSAGYFDLTNKSDEVIAVRLCEATSNPFYECSRPSYRAVLPFENVHALFDPTVKSIEISVLTNNPEIPTPGESIIFDTNQNRKEDISPCALIQNFQDFTLFTVNCSLKNCVLKYKGINMLEPRAGSASKFKKMVSFNKKGSSNLSILDFSSNVKGDDISKSFSSKNAKIV